LFKCGFDIRVFTGDLRLHPCRIRGASRDDRRPVCGDLRPRSIRRSLVMITLEPNATYRQLRLPSKGTVNDHITISRPRPPRYFRRRVRIARLRGAPRRSGPEYPAALQTAAGANHYKLMFLSSGQREWRRRHHLHRRRRFDADAASQVPHAFILDRPYVHGDPELDRSAASRCTAATPPSSTRGCPTQESTRSHRPSAASTARATG
jgi:hypothetical protein